MTNIRLHKTDKSVKMYSKLEVRTRKETIAEKVRIASNSVCTGRTEKKEPQEGSFVVQSSTSRASLCTSTKSWRYISPEKETSTDTKQIKAVEKTSKQSDKSEKVNRQVSKQSNEVKGNQDPQKSTRAERIRASPYAGRAKPKERSENHSKSTVNAYMGKTLWAAHKTMAAVASTVKLASTTIKTVSEVGNSDSPEESTGKFAVKTTDLGSKITRKVGMKATAKIRSKLKLSAKNIRFVQTAAGTVIKPIKLSGTTFHNIKDSAKADLPEASVGQLAGKGASQMGKVGIKLTKNTLKLAKNFAKYTKLSRVKKKTISYSSPFDVPAYKNPNKQSVEKEFGKWAELNKTKKEKVTHSLKNESSLLGDSSSPIGLKTVQRHGVKVNEWANKEKKVMLFENRSVHRNAPSNQRQSFIPKRTVKKGLNNWAGKQTARVSSWANIHAAKAGRWVAIKTSSAVTQSAVAAGATYAAKLGAKVAARAVKTTGAVANAAITVGKTVVLAAASAVNVAVSAVTAIIGAFYPVVILIISIGIVSMLVTSALGIFWSDQTDTGIKIRNVVVEAEAEFQKQAAERVEIAKNGRYGKVKVVYAEDDGTSFMTNNWTDVASVFSVL